MRAFRGVIAARPLALRALHAGRVASLQVTTAPTHLTCGRRRAQRLERVMHLISTQEHREGSLVRGAPKPARFLSSVASPRFASTSPVKPPFQVAGPPTKKLTAHTTQPERSPGWRLTRHSFPVSSLALRAYAVCHQLRTMTSSLWSSWPQGFS